MATTVRLTVLTGPHKNRRFCFRGPTHCIVGRASDCTVRLSGDTRDRGISRHHCRLDINACVRVQDLGSLNGTYRNGRKLEPADMPEDAEALLRQLSVAAEVDDGDIITVGESSFQIDKVECLLEPWTEEPAGKTDCALVC